MSWQEMKQQEGFSIVFLNPRTTFALIWQFQATLSSKQDWNAALLKFVKDKFGVHLKTIEMLNALLTENAIAPDVAAKIVQAFPDAEYEFRFDGEFNVVMLETAPIKKVFSEFKRKNEHKLTDTAMYEQFAFETFNLKVGSQPIKRLLAGKPISSALAQKVLRKFPQLPFELHKVRRGRPKKLSFFEDIKTNGVKYGFVSHGIGMEMHFQKAMEDAFAKAGIAVQEARILTPWQIDSGANHDLHFVANVCLPPDQFPHLNRICGTHSARIVPLYSPQFLKLPFSTQKSLDMKIAVIQGSAEDALSEAIGIPEVMRISKGNEVFQYEFLVQMLEEGRVDGVLINQDSLLHVCLAHGNDRSFAHISENKSFTHEGKFFQRKGSKLHVNGKIKNDPTDIMIANRDFRYRSEIFAKLHQENLPLHNAPRNLARIGARTCGIRNIEGVMFIVEQDNCSWLISMGIYARKECAELRKVIRSKFTKNGQLFSDMDFVNEAVAKPIADGKAA